MFGYVELEIKDKTGKNFYYHKRTIERQLEEIKRIIAEFPFLENYNEIEIQQKQTSISTTRKRNLQQAYQYIMTHHNIQKESLYELYRIITNDLLDDYSKENMSPFYRTQGVYIVDGNIDSTLGLLNISNMDKGLDASVLEERMKDFLDFINRDNSIDAFLLSQIIHFYFVYLHPYFDGNGRTARTLSAWYLLENHLEPYTIGIRGIEESQREYRKSIQKSKKGNITPFLAYMIQETKKQLIKEIKLKEIEETVLLTEEEKDIIRMLWIYKAETIEDIKRIIGQQKKIYKETEIIDNYISLLEKGVLSIKEDKTIEWMNSSKGKQKRKE